MGHVLSTVSSQLGQVRQSHMLSVGYVQSRVEGRRVVVKSRSQGSGRVFVQVRSVEVIVIVRE